MEFIQIAKEEAYAAMKEGEIPVGAVIVKDGEVIARCHNLKEQLHDPTAHAEILAIKEACKVIGDWRLDGCDMYVTLEPCSMCAGAIINSRIKKVYYVVDNNKNVNNNMLITKIKDCEYENTFSEKLSTFFKNKR